mmetsp:Transcript_66483/g.105200  ORF Transcript_66483/g.105200 Transcript_66483/m.105200 type:complete len:245 (+) Transcript_66483:807-1541(+)
MARPTAWSPLQHCGSGRAPASSKGAHQCSWGSNARSVAWYSTPSDIASDPSSSGPFSESEEDSRTRLLTPGLRTYSKPLQLHLGRGPGQLLPRSPLCFLFASGSWSRLGPPRSQGPESTEQCQSHHAQPGLMPIELEPSSWKAPAPMIPHMQPHIHQPSSASSTRLQYFQAIGRGSQLHRWESNPGLAGTAAMLRDNLHLCTLQFLLPLLARQPPWLDFQQIPEPMELLELLEQLELQRRSRAQ